MASWSGLGWPGMATAGVALAAAGALAPLPARAACSVDGSTITCVDDVSAGVPDQFNANTTVIVSGASTVLGGRSILVQHGNANLVVEIDVAEHGLQNDPTGYDRDDRPGVHVLAPAGTIDLTLDGPITILAGNDEVITGTTLLNDHIGGIVAQSLGNIDFSQTGTLVINHADLAVDSATVAGADIEGFNGIRLVTTAPETAPGHIVATRNGSFTLNGGNLTATAVDATGSNRAIAGNTNGVDTRLLYGIYAQGNGDLTLDNTGTVTVNTGTRSARSSSVGGRAESITGVTQAAAIATTRLVAGATGTSIIPGRLNNVTLRQTGDVALSIGDMSLEAIGQTEIDGPVAAAVVQQVSKTSYGLLFENGLNLDAIVDGAITIEGGTITATANALAGPDGARGLVAAVVSGPEVVGMHARSIARFTENDTDNDSSAVITITGDVLATGTTVVATISGSGAALAPVTGFPPPSGGELGRISINGGVATGVYVTGFADENTISANPDTQSRTIETVSQIDLNLGGTVTAIGGDVEAVLRGSETRGATFSGGNALTLNSAFGSMNLTLDDSTVFIAQGGSVEVSLQATDNLNGSFGSQRAVGGRALSLNLSLQSNTDLEFEGVAAATGGNVVLTGNAAAGSMATGGAAIAANLSLDSEYFYREWLELPPETLADLNARQLILTGSFVANGGNASANDADVYTVGGQAIGIQYGYGTNITLRGTVTATGGTGSVAGGAVFGVMSETFYSPGFQDLTAPISTVRIQGSVDVTGAGRGVADTLPFEFVEQILDVRETVSGGVVTSSYGLHRVIVQQDGRIAANGSLIHGIVVASEANEVLVENGGIVRATGDGSSGIEVRPHHWVDLSLDGTAQSTTATIVIEGGGEVISELGTGIKDDERRALWVSLGAGNYAPSVDTFANATTVDLAGTVTGNGVAIDLGDGADNLIHRATGVANGDVLLGSGDDSATIAGGAVINGDFLAGDGDDTVRIADDHEIAGLILLGAGNDTFLLDRLGSAVAADGGDDNDTALYVTSEAEDEVVDLSATAFVFTNFETFAQDGPGKLTLSDGTSIFSRYEVRGGTFAMNAVNTGLDVFVESGGRLMGTGTMGDLVVDGIVAPGNSIGTLVVGDVSFNAGSTYEVEIAAPNQSDLISATGTATINGGALAIVTIDPDQDYAGGQTYRIIEAADVVRASDFTLNQPLSLLSTEVLYGDDFVDLTLVADVPFPTLAQTFNQSQAGMGLGDLEQSGDAQAVFNEIVQLSLQPDGPEAVRDAFDLASGEIHASGQQVIEQTFAVLSRTLRQQGAAGIGQAGGGAALLGYAPSGASAQGVVAIDTATDIAFGGEAWLTPLGGRGAIAGDGNAATLDWGFGGFSGGYRGTIDVGQGEAHGGFAIGYLRSAGVIDERQSSMSADSFHAGVFGGWSDGAWVLSGSLLYAASAITTERQVSFGGIDRTALAEYASHTLALSAEVAHAFDLGNGTTISPLFTLDAGWSGHGGFTETGAGALNLSGDAQSWTRLDAGIGVSVAHAMLTEHGTVTLEGRAVWEHAFADVVPSQTLSFAGSPTGFTVNGPDAGRDRLRLGLGASFQPSDDISIRANYDAVFSGSHNTHAASISFNVKF